MDPEHVSDNPGDFKPGNPHAFKPGQSGNPGGRPKGIERIARDATRDRSYEAKDGKTYTGAAAMIHVLIDVATDPKAHPRDRTGAAVAVLDRGWGKPKQTVETIEPERLELDLSNMTDAQLELLATLPLIAPADEEASEPGNVTTH